MCSIGFGTRILNDDVLEHIYNYLHFDDQLSLSQVSDQTKSVFKRPYRALEVINRRHMFGISTASGVNYKCFKTGHELRSCGVGLQDLADSVRALAICELGHSHTINTQMNIMQFKNLCSLSFNTAIISPLMFNSIVDNCGARVQELSLLYCEINIYPIIDNITTKMKKLKRLQIVDVTRYELKRNDLIKFLNMPVLEYLRLSSTLHYPSDEVIFCPPITTKITKLDISVAPMRPFYWLHLDKLVILNLHIEVKISEPVLVVISENCKILEEFTLNDIYFEDVTVFPIPPKLRGLSLQYCKGLTHLTLKQLLTSTNQITKFCSKRTTYQGEFIDFKPSALIQYLKIDFIPMPMFKLVYENNTQLKELIWRDEHDIILSDVPLGFCSNLQRLDIPCISIGVLARLASLRYLTVTRPCRKLGWYYVLELLKFPTLEELSIRDVYDSYEVLLGDEPSPPVAFRTNITQLTINVGILLSSYEFWLELFCMNQQMTLICGPITFWSDFESICRLVEHDKFPRNLRRVHISGFNVDCNELRENTRKIRDHIFNLMGSSTRWDSKCAWPYRLILSWH